MLQSDFEESVGYWVVMTSRAFVKAFQEELAPTGITYRQWQVLAWLALEGPMVQNDLAERMEIEPATLVSVLARMERDGWIRREDSTLDRRKKIVHPTIAAEPVWKQGVACARRVRAAATRGFTSEQVEMVKHLLGEMRDNLLAEAPIVGSKA